MLYKAKQRQKDKKWDFTVTNDNRTSPTGYCHEYVDLSNLPHHPQLDKIKNNKHKYHSCGHNTEEEAQLCYKEYLLDQFLKLNQEFPDTQKKCVVCGEWTTLYAEIDTRIWNLCKNHNNKEEIEKLFSTPIEIYTS